MTRRNAELPEPLGSVPTAGAESLPPQMGRSGTYDPYLPPVPEGPPPGLTPSPDLAALLRALRRRWLAAFSLGLILALTAGASAFTLLSPSYVAFAQIRVLPYNPSLNGNSLEPTTSPVMYMKSQGEVLKSRPVLQEALKREDVKRLALDGKHAEPIAYLEKNLTVETKDTSDLLTVKFSGDDPQEAVAILKGITEAYMGFLGYTDKFSRANRVQELEKVYRETHESIKTKKANLKNLAEKLGTPDKESVARQREELISGLRELRTQRVSMRVELINAESQLAAVEQKAKAMQQVEITEPVLAAALDADPTGRVLLNKIERLQAIIRDYDNSSPRKDEPTRVRAERLLRDQEMLLAKRRQDLHADLKARGGARTEQEQKVARIEAEHKIKSLNQQMAKLQTEIDEQQGRLANLGGTSNDMEVLQQEIQMEEKSASDIGDRLQKLKIEMRSPDRITLYQESELQAADHKKQMLATIASPVGVLLLVCLGIAWGDFRKRRIYSAGEVAQGLRMRVVGVVPDFPRLERHVLDLDGDPALDGRGVIEAIDAVRTMVLHHAETEGARIFLVTSAQSGEGKSTVASHLAGSLARAGRRTLLIDGDLRRAGLHELFQTPMQPGLSEVLLGEVDLDQGLHETSHENLAVMPAGQWDREVIHALARGGLSELFLRLRQSFDFLILDSHPVLEATDALLIGRNVDAVLLTVLRQLSRMPQVYLAQQRLQSIGAPVLGVVVNGGDPNEVILPVGANPAGQAVAA